MSSLAKPRRSTHAIPRIRTCTITTLWQLGQRATMTADGFEDRTYEGVISHIASVAEFTPRNVQTTRDRVRLVYEVRVRIAGDTAVDLKPGLPTDVRFDLAPTPEVASGAVGSMLSASN